MMSVRALLLQRSATSCVVSSISRRSLTSRKVKDFLLNEPIPPGHTIDSVKPPEGWSTPDPMEKDPAFYVRQPVTSAHAVVGGRLSARDSVSINPAGKLVHGRFGDLESVEHVPLEYLALLGPAAQAQAAVQKLGNTGTLLVFGASQPAGLAAAQLWKGGAVVAVVGGEHSGIDELLTSVKDLLPEPGAVVPEEYAMWKKNFGDVVQGIANGETAPSTYNLTDFHDNLMAYSKAYPETRVAAVSESHLKFQGKEKDRENFTENMEAYLQQFPAGSPPFDPEKVKAYLNDEQYTIFKSMFHKQTTGVVTGDDVGDFNPAQEAGSLIQSPSSSTIKKNDYEFTMSATVTTEAAGPVAGAIIAVTPDLEVSFKAVHEAKGGIRAKAEALQFLTASQRNAYSAASSVVAQAKGKPIIVVGGTLPGMETIEATDEHVKQAIAAMEVGEDGSSPLNFFVQVYRAGDFPIYSDYAIHMAGGPRQVIVTK